MSRRTALVTTALTLVAGTAQAQDPIAPSTWVAPIAVSDTVSVAVANDAAGNPHVVWGHFRDDQGLQDRERFQIRYGWWDADAGRFADRLLDGTIYRDGHPDIAIDGDGWVHVVYQAEKGGPGPDSTNTVLSHRSCDLQLDCDPESPQSAWSPRDMAHDFLGSVASTVSRLVLRSDNQMNCADADGAGGLGPGQLDLALDAADIPHIVCPGKVLVGGGPAWTQEVWYTEEPDQGAWVEEKVSDLVFDELDSPAVAVHPVTGEEWIAARERTNNDLRLVIREGLRDYEFPAGAAGIIRAGWNGGPQQLQVRIGFDPEPGGPVPEVVFNDVATSKLWFAERSDPTSWSTSDPLDGVGGCETVKPPLDFIRDPGRDEVHAVYLADLALPGGATTNVKHLAWRTPWAKTESLSGFGPVAPGLGVALDPDGLPWMCFISGVGVGADLYVRGHDGESWEAPTVAASNISGPARLAEAGRRREPGDRALTQPRNGHCARVRPL